MYEEIMKRQEEEISILNMLRKLHPAAANYVDSGEARIVIFHSTYFAVWFTDSKRWNYIIREGEVWPIN